MILLRSFLSGHIRIKRTLEYYDAGIGPRVPFGGGFGPTVSANFAVALGDFTTLSSTSTMPTGGSISRAGNAYYFDNTGTLQTAATNVARFDNSWNGSAWVAKGLLVEGARTNVFLNSASPATQAITVTAQSYTLSFYGTGTITLSGASTAGPLVGTGANNRVTLTFTPSAGSLTLTLSGTITYPQLEAGSFASSYIVSGGSATTRNAETFSLTGYANRLVEAYYIDEETGGSYSGNSALSTGTVTINPPTFGWVTSLRAYTNAYAGSISTPSWLSFSRSGNAMYYDSTGTLTFAPANLLTYSEDFSNAAWVNAAGGATISRSSATSINPNGASQAISTYTISAVTGANNAFVYEVSGSTVRVGESYVGSVWIRGNGGTSGTIFIYVADAGTAPSAGYFASATVSFTGSWQRFSVKQTFTAATGSSVYFAIGCDARAGNTSSAVVIDVWGAQLERVTYQTAPSAYIPTTSAAVYGPRYDYDPSTVPATPRGLLIEEASTNLARWTTSITDVNWSSTYEVTTPSTTIAPDGTNTAYLAQETTSNTLHYVAQPTLAVTSGVPYTLSCYVKYKGTRYVFIQMTTSPGASLVFDFTTATIASGTGTATNVGNGWYRISTTHTTNATTSGFVIIGPSNNTSVSAYAGNTANGVYLWGAQHEQKAFPTSYVPNNTSSSSGVTRAADVAQLTGSALTTAGAATGTAIVQTTRLLDAAAAHMLLGGSKTTLAARYLMYSGGSNTILSSAVPGTLINSSLPSGGWTTTPVRGAIGWSSAGFCNAVNNSNVTSTTAAQMELASSVYVGSDGTTFFLGGWIASLALYNTRLPDAILKQKSTVGAPY